MTYDGSQFYFVYDFKNRLSEVWRLTVEGQAQRGQSTFISAEALRAGRARVLDALPLRERDIEVNHRALSRQGALRTQVQGMSSGQSASVAQQLVALYGYDPLNRRILRIVVDTGLDQRFAYDGWRELEELSLTGGGQAARAVTQKAFVWGNRLDELLTYHRRDSETAWSTFYATQGRFDSVVDLRDYAGNRVERVEYEVYGQANVYVGSSTIPQATSSVSNPYLYTGRRFDQETGLLYLRNRYLHTGIGRFLTIDSIGSWGDGAGMGNGYAYAGNSPATFSDPKGLAIQEGFDGPLNLPPFVMAAAGTGGGDHDCPCGFGGQRNRSGVDIVRHCGEPLSSV